MSSSSKLFRWLRLVVLGCLLGPVAAVAILLLARHFQPPAGPGSPAAPAVVTPPKVSREDVRAELTGVIESQLAALRKNDYPAAYKFAAAGLRDQMPLPAFERMVRRNFSPIAHSASAEFGVVLDNGAEASVNVDVLSASGRTSHYRYYLRMEATGWRILGVVAVQSAGILV